MSLEGATQLLQALFAGLVIGALAAVPAHLALSWRSLRWTWALVPAGFGAFAVWATVIESWSVALLVAGLCTARWVYQRERRDRESGGDVRRRARQTLGMGDVLRRPRARRQLVQVGHQVDGEGYLLGIDPKGLPVRLRFGGRSGRHGLLLGASGAGKTTALLLSVARHLDRGMGVVVLDMKGDELLASRLHAEAERNLTPFYRWTPEGVDHWNPLARGNRSELKDKLIASEEFSERHYQAMYERYLAMYERYLLNVFRALESQPDKRHLQTVVRLLDPAALAMELRELSDEQAAAEIGDYVQRLTSDQATHLRGLADRLALLVEGGHGHLLAPSRGPDGDIDLLAALAEPAIVVFSLNSSAYGATAKLLGNMVVQDLKAVCGAREAQGGGPAALVAIDEFSGLDGDQVAGLFQRARSAGVSLVLATQELADLRRVDEGFDEQILRNVEYLLAGRQNNPESAETVAAIAGTSCRWRLRRMCLLAKGGGARPIDTRGSCSRASTFRFPCETNEHTTIRMKC